MLKGLSSQKRGFDPWGSSCLASSRSCTTGSRMQTHGQGPDRTQCTAVSVDTSHDITRAHTCARVHVCCMRMPAQHTRVAHLRDLVVELEELEPGERLVDAAAQGPYVCSCRPAQLQHRFGRSILPRSYQRHAPVRARDRRPEIHNLDRRDPVERVAVDLRKGARDDEVACNSSARVESDTGWSETRADCWSPTCFVFCGVQFGLQSTVF